MAQRYYEEFEPGSTVTLGSYAVTEEEIRSFAESYDPQSFHVDPEAAADTRYGQLFASGWHTAAICMRQLVDGLLSETAVVAGVGVDELRWKRPVFGGDELAVSATILETEPWDDDTGLVRIEVEGRTQDGELAVRFEDLALVERSATG
jgi:acyl dehydratase